MAGGRVLSSPRSRDRVRLSVILAWRSGIRCYRRVCCPPDRGPRSIDQAFGLPEVHVTQHLASVLQEDRETRTLMPVWDSSGESRLKGGPCVQERNPSIQSDKSDQSALGLGSRSQL